MLKNIILACIVLGLYTEYPKQDLSILSPMVPWTEAQEQVIAPEVDSWCKGEVNSLFCNPKYRWDAKRMIAICMIENGYHYNGMWNPDMIFDGNADGSVDRGICSINSIHGFDSQLLFDPEYNVDKAYDIWLQQGYGAWAVFNDGRHSLAFQYLD